MYTQCVITNGKCKTLTANKGGCAGDIDIYGNVDFNTPFQYGAGLFTIQPYYPIAQLKRKPLFTLDINHDLYSGLQFAALGREDNQDYYDEFGNHGTVTGTQWLNRINRRVKKFDGTDDIINHGDICNYTNNFTLAAWVNRDAVSDYGGIICRTKTSNASPYEQYALRFDSVEEIEFWVAKSSIHSKYIEYTMSAGINHIALVFNAGYANLYVDGIFVQKSSSSGATDSLPGCNLYIGNVGFVDNAAYRFPGWIADPMIWNRVLTAQEISVLASDDTSYNSLLLEVPKSTTTTILLDGDTNEQLSINNLDFDVVTGVTGTATYCDVTNSTWAYVDSEIDATDPTNTDNGGNTGWNFGAIIAGARSALGIFKSLIFNSLLYRR